MSRFTVTRAHPEMMSDLDAAARLPTRQAASSASPKAGEVVSEIGLLLVLHLAFAFAILLTLQAFGIG